MHSQSECFGALQKYIQLEHHGAVENFRTNVGLGNIERYMHEAVSTQGSWLAIAIAQVAFILRMVFQTVIPLA